jgi:nucleoid DNA-binding protein
MLEKYIKELLFDHDCVVLPEFGGFITRYASAEIHPITHKFNPPARRVAFNEQLKLNDGLLISTLSVQEGIAKEEAARLVKEFADKIKFQMARYDQYVIKDIGRFFYNKENKLEFEPETKVNFLDESFGFTELFFKPIERDLNVMSKSDPQLVDQRPAIAKPKKNMSDTEDQTKKSKSSLIYVVPMMLLLLGGAGIAYYMNSHGQSLSSLNPMSLFSGGEEKQTESLRIEKPVVSEPVVEATPEAAAVPVSTEAVTISERTGRYYVVAGCFGSKENAFKLKDKAIENGAAVSIIEPYKGKPLYTVSGADFDNKKTAVNKMIELRATYGNTIWVKKY